MQALVTRALIRTPLAGKVEATDVLSPATTFKAEDAKTFILPCYLDAEKKIANPLPKNCRS
jgi:hypothetical protein